MKILAVDIGTGTQDILLFDTRLDIENSYKLVLPSPTMILFRRLQAATRSGQAVALHGVMMGGGPCGWAAEAHLRAGLPLYATPEAARTFNDDLQAVQQMGVQLLSADEIQRLPASVLRLEMGDFNFTAIQNALAEFGVGVDDLSAVAVAVFDHGDAPPGISDRQFRFDYLDERIRSHNRLSAFAYPATDIPPILTRLQAVAQSAGQLPCPLVVMDTAPAAVLGATFDPQVAARPQQLIANVGNFHTLAFRLGPQGIEGVFEHHTGLLDRPKLEALLSALADGSLRHADVFNANGHGALIYNHTPLPMNHADFNLVVTGPRRRMLEGSSLRPYFAAPFGDMMIAGCFGLLAAVGDVLPDFHQPLHDSLYASKNSATPPWEVSQ